MSRRTLDSFFHLVSANFGVKIVSIGIAVLLWFVVLGSRNVEVVKEVPLEVATSPEVTPANELPEKVLFRLSGPKAFLRSVLDRREEPIRVNLVGSKPGLVTYRFFPDNIHLPIGVKVLSINPTEVLIKLVYLRTKEIPVNFEIKGNLAEGYRLGKVELIPSFIRVRGPEPKIALIDSIKAPAIDISGLDRPTEKEVDLSLSDYGVQLDSPAPKAHIEVSPVLAGYRIRNIDIRVLSSFNSKLDSKSLEIIVKAPAQELKFLDKSSIYAVLDMKGKPKGKYTERVKVIVPNSIQLVQTIPEQVQVTLY